MTTSDALHWIGAVSLLLYGLASALKPRWIAGLMENGFSSGHGVSEFRIAHGGITGPLFALYVNHPLVFQMLGCACLSAAAVRLLAYLPDRPKLTIDYGLFLLAEIVVGIFLIANPS
ncbi:MAG: hypothetical protein U0694_22815 [Anaerolineae bacterium]